MNKLSVSLIVISSIAACWFSFFAIKDLWVYGKLNAVAEGKVLSWDVVKIKEDQYLLKTNFRFVCKNSLIEGVTVFEKPVYLNEIAAEQAKKSLRLDQWKVWYDSSDPQICSMQKKFPFQRCIQAILSLVVLGYFIVLSKFINSPYA